MSDTVPPAPDFDDDNRVRSAVDWEARFQADATPWERKSVHPALMDGLKHGILKPTERILFPGCGRSLEPLAAAQAGLDVTVLDMAPSAMAWQRDTFTQGGVSAHFVEGDGLTWRSDSPFDHVYEQTFLCALHPHQRQDYERAVRDWLRPGGQLLALFMQKEERGGPPYGCDIAAMRDLFSDQYWCFPEEAALRPYPHPGLNDKIELAGVVIRR
ncbi:methyltransferase domain-containing protein [Woodsholea maritima]|uniref:methyltransferase domain-containing protein n=1 Tax=Woodsholea maritima TaxID=240237 RepID=UPI0003725769|nr:methyltransferase domain-containing protein [Woodsholea maritima]